MAGELALCNWVPCNCPSSRSLQADRRGNGFAGQVPGAVTGGACVPLCRVRAGCPTGDHVALRTSCTGVPGPLCRLRTMSRPTTEVSGGAAHICKLLQCNAQLL